MKIMNILRRLAVTDKKKFNEIRREIQRDVRKRPMQLSEVDISTIEHDGKMPERAWTSRQFVVSMYVEESCLRMTVCRTAIDNSGNWVDKITWDELMSIKEEIGYGDMWGLEVYPPSDQVINVASMRHVFLFPDKPDFAWAKTTLAD